MRSRQYPASAAGVMESGSDNMLLKRRSATGDLPSLWAQTTREAASCPSLSAHIDAEVAVVGAGIAGLSTALHLAEAGISVVVLEAGQPGDGATGKSGGLIAPDFISHTPEKIIKRFGRVMGARLVDLVGSSAGQCFDLVARHKLDCAAVKSGFYCPAHNGKAALLQKQKANEWHAHGYDVRYLKTEETRSALGTDYYQGSLKFADGGGINPLAYCLGLARVAQSAGAKICGKSPVQALAHDGKNWRLACEKGSVRARKLVLAANGGNNRLHPALQATALPMRVYEFATAPLSPELQEQMVPGGVTFTDRQPYLFTARLDDSGRLVSAFPAFLFRRPHQSLMAEAKRRIGLYFPEIAGQPIDYLWEGTAWINPSLLPQIYLLGQDAYAIQACNGRGLAINTALGRQMAEALEKGSLNDLAVKPVVPKPVKGFGLARHIPALSMAAARVGSRLKRR